LEDDTFILFLLLNGFLPILLLLLGYNILVGVFITVFLTLILLSLIPLKSKWNQLREDFKKKKLIQQYQAPDYATIEIIQAGKFPDYPTYQQAQQVGASTIDQLMLVQQYQTPDYTTIEIMQAGKFPDYPTYQQAQQVGASTMDQLKLVQQYQAPDYTTIKKMQAGKFFDYPTYQQAQQVGASTMDQLKLVQRYQAPDYATALKVKSKGFSNYRTYKQATNEGFAEYAPWKLKENRKHKLLNLMKRATSIPINQFIDYMEFPNHKEFLEWLTSLSADSPLLLDGNMIMFKKQDLDDNTAQKVIDEILQACFYCGSILSTNDKRCSHCNQERLFCPICKGAIQFGEETGGCVYCGHNFHYNHFAEWLKVKGVWYCWTNFN